MRRRDGRAAGPLGGDDGRPQRPGVLHCFAQNDEGPSA